MNTKESCPKILKEIFGFVLDNMESENFVKLSDVFIAEKVEKLKAENDQGEISLLNENSTYDLSQYELGDTTKNEQIKIIMYCSHIKGSILDGLSLNKEYKIERQISPPVEAYRNVSFNKMDIKQSKTAYGTLFE